MQKKKKKSKTYYNKIVKNKNKLRITKSSQGKINDCTFNEPPSRLFVTFLVLKYLNCQQRISYPANSSYSFKRKIKTFSRQSKAEEVQRY